MKTRKPKTPAMLAAEASDKLDALAEAYADDLITLRLKYDAKEAACLADLDEESCAILHRIRAEVVAVVEPEDVDALPDELDSIPKDRQ
jgi:hypothetical protein